MAREPGVAMVTLAPELPGAIEVIEYLVANGVTVCAGHTAADGADDEGRRSTPVFAA